MDKKEIVIIEQFVAMLTTGGGRILPPVDCMEYAYRFGWLEAQDILGREQALQRKTAARITHEFLRRELQETDEVDGSPAYRLQDLFDCRVCAGHIIQVYVKGIMDGKKSADDRFVFGTEDYISQVEAEEIIGRVFEKGLRKMLIRSEIQGEEGQTEREKSKAAELSAEQAIRLVQSEKQALLVDVRAQREFEEAHLPGAENIPWVQLLKNPYMVSERRDVSILLYCAEGYQSKAAAQMLLEAGYEKVFYFAWSYKETVMERV